MLLHICVTVATQTVHLCYSYTNSTFVLQLHKQYMCVTVTQTVDLCYSYTNNYSHTNSFGIEFCLSVIITTIIIII